MTERRRRTSSVREKVLGAAKREEQKSGGQWIKFDIPEGTSMFTPKKGIMHIDILPFEVSVKNNYDEVEEGELWYRRKLLVHKNVGAMNDSYICPTTIGKPCPICKDLAPLFSDYKKHKAIIDSQRYKERELFNVLDLDDQDKGVQLWDVSSHLFGKKLLEEIKEGKEEWADFFLLKGGFTLRIRFKEKELGERTFVEAARIDFEPRDDYDESILKKVMDLDTIFSVPNYDELEKAYLDIEDEPKKTETEEKDKGETAPIRRTRRDPEQTSERTGECPHGHKWGSADKEKECDKCPQETWDKCTDEKERIDAENKG